MDENALVSIANQCHIQYGRSVFISRGLLADLTNRNDTYDNLALCSIVNSRSSAQDNVTIEEIALYPNPAQNLMTIASKLNISNYEISNVSGRFIVAGDISKNTLDVSALTVGIYIVKLTDDQGSIHTLKFIKQ